MMRNSSVQEDQKPMPLLHCPLQVLYRVPEFPVIIVYLIITVSIAMKYSVLKLVQTKCTSNLECT